MSNAYSENEVINRYKRVATEMLHYSFPSLDPFELNEAVNYSVQRRFSDSPAFIDNNYKKKKVNTTLSQIADYVLQQEPIITASGCMFRKHADVPNPLYSLIENFIQTRSKYKKEMFKYPKGTENFKKYNLLQLLAKVDNNALYGCIGQYSSMFYNIHVAASTTTQGRSCISSSIMLFESFLANNVKFGSLNEVITFIDNVINEKRTYNDAVILDGQITLEEAYFKIMSTCGFQWAPTEKEMQIVWDIMSRLTYQDLNRLYYKNNLYSFCDNKVITKAIIYILQKLEKPFLNPNEPPEEVKVELHELLDMMKEYVYYSHQIIDKMERVDMMIRDTVLITDTDSCIVSLDAWYRYVLQKVYNVPMEIKRHLYNPVEYIKADEFGEKKLIKPVEDVEQEYEYDFYSDEVVDVKRLIKPCYMIPQDGLRHSIINIIAYCVGQLIVDYMEKFSMNYNSYTPGRKCLLVMKNEFLFKRVLLTAGKKNYAAIQELQEGNIVPKDASLAISGLPIDKVGLQIKTRETLQSILYEDVLNCTDIDQLKLLKAIVKVEKDIYQSLIDGKKEYYKPVNIKSMATYDDPMRIQGIKASVVYNALREDHTEAIDFEKRNSIDIIKVDINHNSVERIKDIYPETYNKIIELMKKDKFSTGIDAIALPMNVEVPKWVLEFVNYTSIINDNVKNFPLESVGLYRMDKSNINYTNILKI